MKRAITTATRSLTHPLNRAFSPPRSFWSPSKIGWLTALNTIVVTVFTRPTSFDELDELKSGWLSCFALVWAMPPVVSERVPTTTRSPFDERPTRLILERKIREKMYFCSRHLLRSIFDIWHTSALQSKPIYYSQLPRHKCANFGVVRMMNDEFD